ncbi:alcohol-forming fatty acyl-CoA reductase-like [Papaver somniferum]|uniref:alcohol-forming fatty acyl-CoA reductase-like n=1 Tax=Papaver somniferum TaxID=3469 RepID=UPI000E6F5CED|nr:alcohol-forming fatty acyl-CoA reductase-like [Papaver somniferum]
MELNSIVESVDNKTILVTGATGFLAKLFVEKLLRVQPNLKQLFLVIRAPDSASVTQRFHNEVIGKEVFRVLKKKHGVEFNSFISEKVTPVAGDVTLENLGINDSELTKKLWSEVDFVANFAATTNFDERYDVAFDINTMGAKHVLEFSKKCVKLKLLLHISTAYVWGEKSGLLLENPLRKGETLNGTTSVKLDSQVEMKLISQRQKELKAEQLPKKEETIAMKEFGLQRARLFGWPNTYVFTKAMGEMEIGELIESRNDLPVVILRPTIITSTFREPFPGWIEGVRTIDSIILGAGKGKVKCFLARADVIMDLIPGDMVVNAAIVAMISHANQPSDARQQFIYQVGSSARAPLETTRLRNYVYNYFSKNPLISTSSIGKSNGKPIQVSYPFIFPTMASFLTFLYVTHMLPLKGLRLANAVFCNYFRDNCNDAERKITFITKLVKLYEPYILFKGIFDDLNTERLRIAVRGSAAEADTFYFDPNCINWDEYFMNTHIPGLVQYALKY